MSILITYGEDDSKTAYRGIFLNHAPFSALLPPFFTIFLIVAYIRFRILFVTWIITMGLSAYKISEAREPPPRLTVFTPLEAFLLEFLVAEMKHFCHLETMKISMNISVAVPFGCSHKIIFSNIVNPAESDIARSSSSSAVRLPLFLSQNSGFDPTLDTKP